MRLELQNRDHFIFAGRVLAIAHHYSTMKDLAEKLETTAFTVRYRLGKARKLDEVKKILNRKKTDTSEVIE